MLKVALICNMNNNFFTLTRYLRDRGIEADLFLLNNEFPHFHPSADSFTNDYRRYTTRTDWGHYATYVRFRKDDVLGPLEKYDVLIGCGKVPAFLSRAGRNLDILIPYGSEIGLTKYRLNAYPSGYPIFSWRRVKSEADFFSFTRHERAGMAAASYCLDQTDRCRNAVNYRGTFSYMVPPWVYTPVFNPANLARMTAEPVRLPMLKRPMDRMNELRKRHSPIVFHHTRHVWKSCPDGISWKANDKLIRGFANFVKKSRGRTNPCLVTCDYGHDVAASKQLIAELDIEQNVHWMPLMQRKEIMLCLSLADFGSSEFHESWLHCGTIHETLAAGRPLLHYRLDHLYEGRHPDLYPIVHVSNQEDVSDALLDFMDRPEHYRDMGERGRQWYEREMAHGAIDVLVAMIEGRFGGNASAPEGLSLRGDRDDR